MKKNQYQLGAIFCLVLICILPKLSQAEELELRVIVQRANIRLGPDTGSEIILQVSLGTVLKSDTKEGNWFRVLLPPDKNGIERSGYIHSSIVEVLTKQREPLKKAPEEPEKEAPKRVEKTDDTAVKPEEPEKIPGIAEPPKLKAESLISRLLKNVSLKLNGGPGFFINGAGDLEKLRLETKDYIEAMGELPFFASRLNRYGLDVHGGIPSYKSEFSWNPLRTNTDFQFGLNYDITDKFSVGISSGIFSARNENIQYSHGYQLLQEEEWWTYSESASASYLEDHKLRATPWFLNFSYSSNPLNSRGRFSPELSVGLGPICARIERSFSEEKNYNADYISPYYSDGWDHEWTKTTIEGDWKASTLGAQICGGIDWNVTSWMTLGVDGFVFLANFKNWKGTEKGSWEWGLQRWDEDYGGIYQDESDSGGWDYGPDTPLVYYQNPVNGVDHPMMFIRETLPENGFTPSINWNTWGLQLTAKFSPGGTPGKTRERGRKPPQQTTFEIADEPPGVAVKPKKPPTKDRTTTRTREPATAPPDEAFTSGTDDCRVGLLVIIGIQRAGGGRTILSHNLKHGFSEVVIPKGYNGRFIKFEPVPSETGPYKGIFSATWTASGQPQSASAGRDAGDLVRNFIRARRNWRGVQGSAPEVQNHTITANWDPDNRDPCSPPISHSFKVIFAGDNPPVAPLRLGDFYGQHSQAGFPGGGTAPGTGTRIFHDSNPAPRARRQSVHVPIGIYWEVGVDCCGIEGAVPKVIQFARATIDGPNGRQGKPWTLDILDSQANRAPNHDPTYTGRPSSDKDERPSNGGSGGTRRVNNDLTQWDAPGMPSSLYHRLLHAEGSSHYRQQFLSLLVCRPNPGSSRKHRSGFYLSQAKVKQIAITTVSWTFPGQRGIDRTDPNNLRQPTVRITFFTQDGGCQSLQAVLDQNGLTETFQNPSEEARKLEILPEGRYRTLLDEVTSWEQSPADKVRLR